MGPTSETTETVNVINMIRTIGTFHKDKAVPNVNMDKHFLPHNSATV